MNVVKFLIVVLTVLSMRSTHAVVQCSEQVEVAGSSCSFLNTQVGGQPVANLVQQFAGYTQADLESAIQNQDSNCRASCLLQARQTIGANLGAYNSSLTDLRRKIVIQNSVDKMDAIFNDLTRASESLSAYSYISSSQLNLAQSCQFDRIENLTQSCRSKPYYNELVGRFKQMFKLNSSAGLKDSMNQLSSNINLLFARGSTEFKCSNDFSLSYNDFFHALGAQNINRNDLAALGQPGFYVPAGACAEDRKCIGLNAAKAIALQRMTPEQRNRLGQLSAEEFSENPEADREFRNAMSLINNPLIRPFLDSLNSVDSLIRSLPNSNETFAAFTARRKNELLSLLVNQRIQQCNAIETDMAFLLCADEAHVPLADQYSFETSVQDFVEDDESTVPLPVRQIAAMDLICSVRRDNAPRTRIDVSFLKDDSFEDHNFLLQSQNNLTRIQPTELYETTFNGFARMACLANAGDRSEFASIGSLTYGAGYFERSFGARAAESQPRRQGTALVTTIRDDLWIRPVSDLNIEMPPLPDLSEIVVTPRQTIPEDVADPVVTSDIAATAVTNPASDTPTVAPIIPMVVPPAETTVVPAALSAVTVPAAQLTDGESEVSPSSARSLSRSPASTSNNEELLRQVAAAETRVLELNNAALQRRVAELEAQKTESERLLAEERTRVPSNEVDPVVTPEVQTSDRPTEDTSRGRSALGSSSGGASVTPPRALPANAVSVSDAISSPVAVSSGANSQNTISDTVIASGGIGLDGPQSARAAAIRRSVVSGARSLQIRRDSSTGEFVISNEQGEGFTSETPVTDQDILAILSDINSNPDFRGVVKLEGDTLEIVVGERRIVVDTNQIQDRSRRLQIAALSSEIKIRQTRKVQTYFAAELSRRLGQVRAP